MSQIPQLPEFDELANTFLRMGALQSPSELQGYLAGQLAVDAAMAVEDWLKQAVEFIDCIETPTGEDHQALVDLYEATRRQLEAGDMSLRLLLPDDDVDISQRVEALGHWCQGFLAGFALGGKQIQQREGGRQYSSEVSEALSDMAAISQAGIDESAEDADPENLEGDFFEVGEYVRLAAINVYIECHQSSGVSTGQSAKPSLH